MIPSSSSSQSTAKSAKSVDDVQESTRKILLNVFEVLLEVRNAGDSSTLGDPKQRSAELFAKVKEIHDSIEHLHGSDRSEAQQREEIEQLSQELVATKLRIRDLERELVNVKQNMETSITETLSDDVLGLSSS